MKEGTKKAFSGILAGLVVFLNLCYIALLWQASSRRLIQEGYLYFNLKQNLFTYLLYLLLYLLPMILALLFLWKLDGRGMRKLIIQWILLPVSLVFLQFGMLGYLKKLPVASITEDPANYLKVDSKVSEYAYCYEDFLPAEIPVSATDVSYWYSYETSGSGTRIRIEASWFLPEEEYPEAKQANYSTNERLPLTNGFADRIFHFNDEEFQVFYRVEIRVEK